MRVRLDEESLKTIANLTRGEYFYAGNAIDLQRIYRNLNTKLFFEQRETEVTALFAAAAAVLALVSATLSMLWFNRVLLKRRTRWRTTTTTITTTSTADRSCRRSMCACARSIAAGREGLRRPEGPRRADRDVGPRSARTTARAWSPAHGRIRDIANGCSPMRRRRSRRWATPGARASTWSCCPTARACGAMVVCARAAATRGALLRPPPCVESAPLARAVIDPRGVLAGFGVIFPPTSKCRLADSHRGGALLVLPSDRREPTIRPRNSWPRCHARFDDRHRPRASPCCLRTGDTINGVHDIGGMQDFGPVAGGGGRGSTIGGNAARSR